MDKNFIFAILLSALVVVLFSSPQYQKRFGKEVPVQPAMEETIVSQPRPAQVQDTQPSEIQTERSEPQDETADSIETDRETIQIDSPQEQDFTLENEDVRLLFSTRGGIIINATMLQYIGPNEDEYSQLVYEGEAWYNGRIVDGDAAVEFSDIIFSLNQTNTNNIVLRAELNGDRSIIREFSLDESGFMLHASTRLEGNWGDPIVQFTWSGPLNETEAKIKKLSIWPLSMIMPDDSNAYTKVVYLGQGDRTTTNDNGKEKTSRIYSKEGSQRIEVRKPGQSGQDVFAGDLDWYAVRSKYFMSAAIPKENMRWSADTDYLFSFQGKWYDFTLSKHISDGDTDLDIYIGPISYDILKNYNRNLTELMELSWRFIRPLSISFLWLLKKLRAFIPNWGLVIIVFSIIIKIVLYPLSHKSIVSMRKMSALKPQIDELRVKHKNNPQNLQKATMALYKQEGVNPFGGCLPMLLQMPVLFAMYPVIGRSFELRQAMFIPHWIVDLSRPDPYYILPVAMGVTMFMQSKQTMTDPNQKAMLYVMPVMMVLLFANFSSGLTLYWFLFNIMTIMQQRIHKHQ